MASYPVYPYDCLLLICAIFVAQTFVDGSDGRVMWESLGDAWHMSVGLFMILLFVVWLLSLPSWFPGCRGRGPCLCCLCCPCCRRQDDRVRFADGKPRMYVAGIKQILAQFVSLLAPQAPGCFQAWAVSMLLLSSHCYCSCRL